MVTESRIQSNDQQLNGYLFKFFLSHNKVHSKTTKLLHALFKNFITIKPGRVFYYNFDQHKIYQPLNYFVCDG
jgi:hypothetical protein